MNGKKQVEKILERYKLVRNKTNITFSKAKFETYDEYLSLSLSLTTRINPSLIVFVEENY